MLLVHNETADYLLLSNAGGCRALAGTDLCITEARSLSRRRTARSAVRVDADDRRLESRRRTPFSPRRRRPGRITGRPPDTVNVNGTWDLYIVDTATTIAASSPPAGR